MIRREEGSRYSPFVPDDPGLRWFAKVAIGYPPFLALLGFVAFWVYLIYFASTLRNFGAQGDPNEMPLALQSIAYFLLLSLLYNLLVFPLIHALVKVYKPGFAVKSSYFWMLWALSVFTFFLFFDEVLWLLD